MPEQLVFDFKIDTQRAFNDYYDPSSGQLLFCLSSLLDEASVERFLYLWGAMGVGKTHLLTALVERMHDMGGNAFYLDCRDYIYDEPCLLDGMEQMALVCIDNVDKLMSYKAHQEALFNLYNRIRDNQKTRLVASAMVSPKALPLELADLTSRLSWGISFKLEGLDEDANRQLLKERAELRGFVLSDSVLDYIMTHYGRKTVSLLALLEKLDKASLSQHRRITIPFVKKIIESLT